MTTVACLVHGLPGRTRLRLPAQRGRPACFAELVERLQACPGVQRVVANPDTASLLLEHHVPFADIVVFARQQELFDLEPSSAISAGVTTYRDWLSRQLQAGRHLNVRSLVVSGLVALSLVQIARGQILAPASTLLWYAWHLQGLDRNRVVPP
jgi:hypothetical protein